MSGSRFVLPSQQPIQATGLPYFGGTLGFYLTGTSTPTPTYQDSGLSIDNLNPLPLDSAGNIGNVFLDPTIVYKVVLEDSAGDLIWTYDPVYPFADAAISGITNAGTTAGSADAQILNGYSTFSNGQIFEWTAGYTNTGAMTLSGFQVYQPGPDGPQVLTGSEVTVGTTYFSIWLSALNSDAGGFQLTSPLGISPAIGPALQASTTGAAAGLLGLNFGQVHFAATSTTAVALVPKGGAYLTIAGVDYPVPSGGVAATITSTYVNGVAATALTASTLYYVYAFMLAGVLTLNFSTTAHATDTTAGNVGVEIMTGDNAYSLVGMVYPTSGPVLGYSGANQLVLSWFNKSGLAAINIFTAGRSTTSGSYAEVNSEIRCQFLVWSGDSAQIEINGSVESNTAMSVATAISIDSTSTPQDAYTQGTVTGANQFMATVVSRAFGGLAEGFHYATLLGLTSAGAPVWSGGGSQGSRTSLSVAVRG
jgi:hypothetical protein